MSVVTGNTVINSGKPWVDLFSQEYLLNITHEARFLVFQFVRFQQNFPGRMLTQCCKHKLNIEDRGVNIV